MSPVAEAVVFTDPRAAGRVRWHLAHGLQRLSVWAARSALHLLSAADAPTTAPAPDVTRVEFERDPHGRGGHLYVDGRYLGRLDVDRL